MRKLTPCRLAAFLLLAAVAWTAPAVAQTELIGNTAGGAVYHILVPSTWNGDLVIWNHGFTLDAPGLEVDLGPLAELQTGEGFAVAASSYRQVGWALFKTVQDLRALVAVFREQIGEPQRIFLVGASLGGIVTAQALEKGNLGNVVGALIWCGAVAGSRNWDGAIDLRLTYDAVCQGVKKASIPGGAEGLPEGSTLSPRDVEKAVNKCTGVDRPAGKRSAAQQRRLDQILDNLGLSENFLQTDMWFATFGLSDLTHHRGKLRGKVGVGNAGVSYRDAAIDAAIERVTPHRGAARRLARFYTPTGQVGNAKIVGLHTDKDGLVVVENLGDYAAKLPPAQIVAAVAVEDTPTHCGFTEAEAVSSWEALVAWANGGSRPDAAAIQGLCQTLVAAGALSGPCRIDPNYVIGDLDDRIPPR